MTHELKTINPYFNRCWECSKTFEVRKNDRDFQKGDKVWLKEYDADKNTYTGRELLTEILYVLVGFENIEPGYVVFSFHIIEYIQPKQNLTKH